MLPGNAPHVLRRARVTFDCTIAHRPYPRFQRQTALGQHSHGSKRDGEEPNTTSLQLPVTVAKMLTSSVRDRPPPFGQAERSIDGNKVRLGLLDGVQDVVIAERDGRLCLQAAKKTQTCRTTRRPRKIDPKNNKRLAVRHNELRLADSR